MQDNKIPVQEEKPFTLLEELRSFWEAEQDILKEEDKVIVNHPHPTVEGC